MQGVLEFHASPGWCDPSEVCDLLRDRHYLGPIARGIAWRDEFGAIVLSAPTSRRLPATWLELTRWCLDSDVENAGSLQWGRVRREISRRFPDATTIVSYSDPSIGHTGTLYRACNWWWAPTWHRLRPPPTGNGRWSDGESQAPKDRWVFPLKRDGSRAALLRVKDSAVEKAMPWAVYKEPGGADFRRWTEQQRQEK